MKNAAKLLETAAAELRAGRHGPAERGLRKLLKARPRDPVARHLLGLVYLARGEAGSAAGQFRLAVDAGAGADAEVNLALALVVGGLLGEAEHVLRSVVEKAPTHVGAVFNLGHLLRMVGSTGEAETSLRRTLELDESHVAAHCELGLALMESGAFDDARQCLETVLAREPGHQVAVLNIARIDQRLGCFKVAADGYRSLREAGSNDPEVDLGLAACLQELDHQDDALELYRALLKCDHSLYPRILRALTGASRATLTLRPSAMRALLIDERYL